MGFVMSDLGQSWIQDTNKFIHAHPIQQLGGDGYAFAVDETTRKVTGAVTS